MPTRGLAPEDSRSIPIRRKISAIQLTLHEHFLIARLNVASGAARGSDTLLS